MITSQDWDRLTYRFPNLKSKGREIGHVLGLDTEAYTTGAPFLVCLSDGAELEPERTVELLLDRYDGQHIVCYNLKYDSGAVLYHVPPDVLRLLWERGRAQWGKVRLQYIPHKFLGLTRGKAWVKVWDVSQFYAMSLDAAAKRYLSRSKVEMETKRFTPQYVAHHREAIKRYCVEDARLCADLGNLLVRKLREFGIRVTALYSSAALSFRYFADRTRIVTVWRYWRQEPDLLRAALDAYAGGKFEVTGRGTVEGYEYDLASAYPCEIADLVDVELARVVHSRSFEQDATYGFIRCRINNVKCAHIPCGPMDGPVRIYPAGEFYHTVTKAEYEYCLSVGCKIDIVDAWWLFVDYPKYPYRETVGELFKLKSLYKGKDASLYEVAKRMANSFYGKTVQAIEDWKGKVVAGAGWNPIFGAVITANTRIKVCRVQNEYGPRCLAVHTDSVITTDPLPDAMIREGVLGEFSFVEQGSCTIVACGQYSCGSKDAFKGFVPRNGDTWPTLLERHHNRTSFEYPVTHVESWVEVMARGRTGGVNVFHEDAKLVDLNADTKRTWLRRVRGGDLLGPVEQSVHRPLAEVNPPEWWRA